MFNSKNNIMKKIKNVKIAISALCLSFVPFCCFSQEIQDTVRLNNGQIVTGKIVEQFPDKSLKIKTLNGELYYFQFSDILNKDSAYNSAETLPKVNYQPKQEDIVLQKPVETTVFHSHVRKRNREPKLFRNELKFNVLSPIFSYSLEFSYEYNLNRSLGIGNYFQAHFTENIFIVRSAEFEGVGFTPFFRGYFNKSGQANGFFIGISSTYATTDYSQYLGLGTMIGFKNNIRNRFAIELAGNLTLYNDEILDNHMLKAPLYLGVTVSIGIRF
jgi:hypothetical protein